MIEILSKEEPGNHYYTKALEDYQNEDYKNAFVNYFEAARTFNHGQAQFALGRMYEEGEGVGVSLLQAFRWYRQSAGNKNSDGALYTGLFYSRGVGGVQVNLFEALKWYEVSASSGNETAIYYAGCLLCDEVKDGPSDPEKGFNYLLQLAKKGNSDAQCKVGICYEKGTGVTKDIKLAKYWYLEAAKVENPTAQYRLGLLYRDGNGVDQNYTKATLWFEKASLKNLAESLFSVGQLYEDGLGVEPDSTEAIVWYEKAANQGHVQSTFILAKYYEESEEQDYSQARYWYERGASYGDNNAECELGVYYNFGYGIDVDYEKAMKWYTSAHNHGNQTASLRIAVMCNEGNGMDRNLEKCFRWLTIYDQHNEDHDGSYEMAELYHDGDNVEKNYREAVIWYERSINNADVKNGDYLPYMYYTIADIYDDGGFGVKQDYSKAMKYYTTAHDYGSQEASFSIAVLYNEGNGVEKNLFECLRWLKIYNHLNEDHDGFYNMAQLYYEGIKITKNYKEALGWYKRAIENSDIDNDGYLDYMYYTIAYIYNAGEHGVKQDYKKANHYFELAAKRGDNDALFQIGINYFKGNGVEKNNERSMDYITRAADQGHILSLQHIADSFRFGYGVERDFKKCMEYYLKAVELGSGDAMNNIGDMYENGEGVEKDYNKAMEWYQKAIDAGSAIGYSSMGNLYRLGSGATQDPAIALEWYEKALECDSSDCGCAYNYIGLLYTSGHGVEQNDEKAFEYFTKAANEGSYLAFKNLGDAYQFGRGTEQDYTAAIEWYTKGADLYCDLSQYNLGKMYLNGLGTKPNMEAALEWFQKAYQAGNKEALIEILQIEMRRLQIELSNSTNSDNTSGTSSAFADQRLIGHLFGQTTGESKKIVENSSNQSEVLEDQRSNDNLSQAIPPSNVQLENQRVSATNDTSVSDTQNQKHLQFFYLQNTQTAPRPSPPQNRPKTPVANGNKKTFQFFQVDNVSPVKSTLKDRATVKIKTTIVQTNEPLQFFSV